MRRSAERKRGHHRRGLVSGHSARRRKNKALFLPVRAIFIDGGRKIPTQTRKKPPQSKSANKPRRTRGPGWTVRRRRIFPGTGRDQRKREQARPRLNLRAVRRAAFLPGAQDTGAAAGTVSRAAAILPGAKRRVAVYSAFPAALLRRVVFDYFIVSHTRARTREDSRTAEQQSHRARSGRTISGHARGG